MNIIYDIILLFTKTIINMLDTLKKMTAQKIQELEAAIKKNEELVAKRSRKTLDVIANDKLLKEGYERDLKELHDLTKGK